MKKIKAIDVKDLVNKCFELGEQLKEDFEENDVRYLFYQMCGSECLTYIALLKAIEIKLQEVEFWKGDIGVKTEIDEKFISDRQYEIHQSYRTAFYLATMINYETCIRAIAEKLVTNYVFTNSIKDVCEQLIHSCSLDSKYEKLNSILHNIRNAMHNGWIHRHNDKLITFNNITFDFKKDKPIAIKNEDLEMVLIQLLIFWKELVQSVKVKEMNYIEHPNCPFFNLNDNI